MRELLDTRVGLSLEVGVRSLRHEARTAGPGLASGGKGGVDASFDPSRGMGPGCRSGVLLARGNRAPSGRRVRCQALTLSGFRSL